VILIILFFIGLLCFLATIGTLLKYILGRGFQDNFVSNFMKKATSIIFKIGVLFTTGIFIYVIVALIQSLFI